MNINERKIEMISRLKQIKPLPFEEDCQVKICFSCDANYEPHLWVTISSMIDNAKSNKRYHIYILDGGIKNKENFFSLVKNDSRFSIKFINMQNQFSFAYQSRHLSRAAYYRLAVFKLFKNFNRLIYIDADSYILGDIGELMNLPMGKKLISGSRDSITYEIPWREKYISYANYSGKALNYYKDYLLKNKSLDNYFSSGVLVFNLKDMDLSNKQSELERLLLNDYFSHDQDILNLLFNQDETYPLPREWNYFNSGPILKPEDFVNNLEKENYLDGKVKPKIVSYVLKPWLKEYIDSPYADLYWNKIKKSPYYIEVKRNSLKNSKLERFRKLSFVEKIKFLMSSELRKKLINKLLK